MPKGKRCVSLFLLAERSEHEKIMPITCKNSLICVILRVDGKEEYRQG